MQIEQITVGAFEVNCWLISGSNNQTLVVDPGDDTQLISDTIDKKNLHVAAYLMTHGHMDHINALAQVHKLYPAPVIIHPDDLKWAFSKQNTLPPFFIHPPQEPVADYVDLASTPSGTHAGLNWQSIHTPGHTPGGVCFYFPEDNALFSGDTLFAGSVGRTDLPGGNPHTLTLSLKKLIKLPDNTRIYPGHGPATSLAQEKRRNPFLS